MRCDAMRCADGRDCLRGAVGPIDAPLNVACAKRAIDNTWWCACGSGPNTTKFELGAASDSKAACALASPHCLAQMSLQLGPADWGGATLPNPLP